MPLFSFSTLLPPTQSRNIPPIQKKKPRSQTDAHLQ